MKNSPQDSSSNDKFSTTLQQEFTETFHLSKFEVKTLVSLVSDKTFDNDSLHCASSPSFIVIAIGNRLSVFNEDSFELHWEMEFDFRCEWITLSDDFCLLLVVEHPGTLHLLHLPTCKLIWSYNCKENGYQCTVQSAFICSSSPGSLSIFVYSKEGTLYAFSKMEAFSLYKAVEDGTLTTFFSDIDVEKIDLTLMFPHISIKSAFETYHHNFLLGLESEANFSDTTLSDYYTVEEMIDGDFFCDWESNNEEDSFFNFYDFTGYDKMIKTASTRDGRYVISLTSKHMLLVFCSFTHAALAEWGDGDIENFVLKSTIDPENVSMSNYEIGILRKYGQGHIFEIRKFPSFDLVHKILLSEFVQLIETKPNQDSWYIVEEEQYSSKSERTKSLKVKSISETRPESRLLGLLNRRKFREAEKYAGMCNLDTEVIYKTKLNCMMKDYTANPALTLSKVEQDYLWKEIENSFNKIKDVSFIKSCILFLTPEADFVKMFLSQINAWLTAHIDYEGVEELICQLNKNENKVITYNVLPDDLKEYLTLKEFLKKDLLQFMTSELISGSLSSALIIWQRHKDEMLISLTGEQIREILDAIPDDISSQHLIPFLKEDFLPFVLSEIPEVVDVVADWIISHIHLLELTEKAFWPENGDQLASVFFELLHVLHEKGAKGAMSFTKSISLSCIHKKIISPDARTGYLFELSKNLKLLVSLKENFNCKISLTTFQDSKMDVIFAVLDRINMKFLEKAISDFARPYALENDLDLDQCLELYIKNTLQTSYFTWWSWDEAPWEDHLSLVLECIHDSGRWMNAALMLVSHATVPWSDRVKTIVERGLNSNHPSAEEFKQQSRQVGLKEVLVKYDIRNFPMNNDVQLIYTLVNYIFKLNRASALEDTRKVMLSFNDSLTPKLYFKYLQFFLNQDKLGELKSLFSSMPSDITVECSYKLLRSIMFGLEDRILIKHNKDRMKTYLGAGIYFIEFLKSKKQPFDSELLDALRSLQKLQKEFNLDATLSDVMNKHSALHIIEDMIDSFLDKETVSLQGMQTTGKSTSVSLGVFKVNRLGDILCLDRTSVTAVLITSCLQRKMYNLAIELCRDLITSYPTTHSAETLMEVINHFYQNFQNIKNMSFQSIMDTVCYLSNLAITFCEDNAIEKSLYVVKLSTYFAVLGRITGQQSSFLPPTFTGDAYHKWKFNPIYDDEGLHLDINITVDFVLKLLPLFLRNSSNLDVAIDFQLEDTLTLFKPLILHMKKKGQGVAALRTMYLFYHLEMEFLQNITSAQQAFQLIKGDIIEIVIQLIQRTIDKRKLDLELSIGLLCTFPDEQAQILKKLQRWCSKDLKCLMSLGEIGYEFFRLMGDTSKSSEYDKVHRRALLLLKQNIKSTPADMVLNSTDPEYNWEVVKQIVLSSKVNLSTVLECCSAFDLVTDHVLVAFLNHLLVESDKTFANTPEILEKDISLVLNQARCVIESISSKELLVNNLENLLKKIGSYSYEILLFIHEQLISVAADILTVNSGYFEKGIPLLNFLRVYDRVSLPGETELDQWISAHSWDSKLPAISSKRLPFWILCSDKAYKIINPELTASTLTVWLRIASLLKTSKDELVMIAIKNNVQNYIEKLPAKHFVINQDATFLRSIHDMLQHISDLKFSTAAACYVSNRLPPGGNKVCAGLIATKFAKRWCDDCPNDQSALDFHKKLSAVQQRSAVESILHQNNLASEEYLSYTHNPAQLIENITEEFCSSPESSIKVCKVAGEISKVVDINLVDIFFRFFYKWLNISYSVSDNFDETFAFNNSGDSDLGEDRSDDKNILRAINLLLGVSTICPNICKDMKENYQKMTVIQRSRCLFCMVSVFDFTTVADILKIPAEMVKDSLALFLYTSELESLHLLYSRDMVLNCDKKELIYRILCNQSTNPKVLLCCVRMSLECNVWCSEIWDTILQRLVVMSLTDCLQDILQVAQGKLVHMWHYKSFISAWNCIISSRFKSESVEESETIEKINKTILGCPCATALDVESLWNDLKYSVNSINREKLKHMEPVSDICSLLQALKSLQETC